MQEATSTGVKYRKLSSEEIGQLIMQGCTCDNWDLVEADRRFITDNIRNAHFSGHNRLGVFENEVELFGGVKFKTGIYNAWLNNCTVGDNVLIHNVGSYISNYIIEEDVIIHNVNTIAVSGMTSFGNGTRVKAINEDGGREVTIYDHLTTHLAYILSMYRHRKKLVKVIEGLIKDYVDYISYSYGTIARGASIINCGSIKNVKIGLAARLEGVQKLNNGSINSSYEDPVHIGEGVIMDDFIVCSGSEINDATLITRCFIGQGCVLDKHYSAVDSLFFANCRGFHGEACSIFAGPYTVTHHKSTLLIAGMFSFLNAGSGSNQSNHLYKLGPIHQGIIERGVKTTSDSYLLWPSHVGAFSLVMGRHYKHSDTSQFPFSYLIESNDESILVPAINLKSIGTIRDSKKWPRRDGRKGPNKLDQINFNLLSPYTVQKMIAGREILLNIKKASGEDAEVYTWQRMKIQKHALDRGIHLYELAIYKFFGNSLITRLQQQKFTGMGSLRKVLEKDTPVGPGRWIDLSGLICPAEALEGLLKSIEEKRIGTIEEINSYFISIHNNYYNYEWSWVYDAFRSFTGKDMMSLSIDDLIDIIEKWLDAVLTIDHYLWEDASKEFSLLKRTGFGIDGEAADKNLDFESVRGEFETNPMVVSIREHINTKEKLGEGIISGLKSLKN
ncbi:MAG: DUF4954 family protein [Bacteroidales bacterium]|nr:DUF4954 family protein [Bacteroidales bacterium]